MSENGSNNHHPRPDRAAVGTQAAAAGGRRRSPWPLAVVAALFVIVPFLTWYGTSFWRTLSEEEVAEYLSDQQRLRHVQHALEEIDRRIVKGDEATRQRVRRWYPQIVGLAASPSPDIRLAAAWVMGDDNGSEEFHAALLALLRDPEPSVRRMAALSLTRFNDPSGREELLGALRPYNVKAPFGGTVLTVLPEGSRVRRGALLARVRDAGGQAQELRSPLSGRVEGSTKREGASVSEGEELLVLSPDGENVLQALRALYLVGRAEDLPEVERYARGVAGMPGQVKEQAALTAEEIKRRAGRS